MKRNVVNPRVLFLLVPITLWSCGDRLANDAYRGEPLLVVSGIIEPASEFDGAEYVCSFESDECYNRCYELEQPEFAESEFEPDPEEEAALLEAMNSCWDACNTKQIACLQDYEGTDFASAYYSSDSSHRIAIIWANPKYRRGQSSAQTSGSILQQRSVTSTGFPARYSFSIYQPPPAGALFTSEDARYAYGIIVTYHDLDGDEMLDITQEPIIGFSVDNGVLYTTGGSGEQSGYRLYTASFGCGLEFLESTPLDASTEGTNLAISGASPAIFDRIPDVGCDDSHAEWLDLCDARTHRARCLASSVGSLYAPICRFCSGAQPRVDFSMTPELGDEPLPEDDQGGPDEHNGSDDTDECESLVPAERELCAAERDRDRCLEEAQNDSERVECEAEYNQRVDGMPDQEELPEDGD